MKYFILIIFVLIGLIHANRATGQQDFNYYKPLQSIGEIPTDFYVRTSEKIQEDMKQQKENLNAKQQKIFLEGVHYGVDEILQSGLVIYGDEISEYVTQVAHKLLEKEPKLKKELRFYTIKSNVTNAFSTDQGIVFVTTGFISQISSEAQLAYVLAHEISHYTEKHVVETFEYRNRNKGINSQIQQLSSYSQEKEFEADVEGVKLFHAAGYSMDFLTTTFDVLMYSYLPIDEIPFPKTYFNSDLCFVPEFRFSNKEYPIKAEEDFDDSRSTHPNIRKRKNKAMEAAKNYNNWGNVKNHFGEERFLYVRNLARFERVRSDLIELQYGDALYTIFILEQEFPNSLYLHRMKAQCWYGISLMKQENKINQVIQSSKDLEGEGAQMHAFLKNLKEIEVITLAARQVEDCRLKFPEDIELKTLSERTNISLFSSDQFSWSELKDHNFQTGWQKFKANDTIPEIVTTDTVGTEQKLSKYEKIKQKRANNGYLVGGSAVFDSTEFYKYLLSDMIVNEGFKTQYENFKIIKEDEKAVDEAFKNMTRSEKAKFLKEKEKKEAQIDLSNFILVDPAVVSYRKGKVDLNESEKMENQIIEGYEYVADELGLKMSVIGKGNLQSIGTDGFNEKTFFTSMLIQVSNARGVNVFPVDFSMIKNYTEKFGTNKLVFSVVEHAYFPKFSPYAYFFIFFPPGILGYIPIPFIQGNQTEMNLIVLDLEKTKVLTSANYFFNEPLNKFTIEARIYDIFLTKNAQK